MNSHFPIDIYPSMKNKNRKTPRLRYFLVLLIIFTAWYLLIHDGDEKAKEPKGNAVAKRTSGFLPSKPPVPVLTKGDLVSIDEETIKARNLTIDWDLQQYITDLSVQYKLFYGSIAVMDARTGDVLALYGKNQSGQDCSLGLDPELAASIFKLVTAVAAMDQAGFTSQSTFFYTGNAHTLYKRQLTNKRDRWTEDISLADAFARSNNIVFGKLGSIYLGLTPIDLTTRRLGFWKSPLKEFSSTPSTSFSPKDDYNLAELACGFNKQTRISPLHAAEMVTAALNDGYMVTPRIVRTMNVERRSVMKQSTARDLSFMMERTVKRGTVSKTFRGVSSDRVLKKLDIGGKSGSIDGDDPKGRRNWFAGFARNRETGEGITIGCLLILDDHFWIEADMFTRLVIRHYFESLQEGRPPVQATYERRLTATGSKGLRSIP